MAVLDPESEAVVRRIEASIDVDGAWAQVQRRSRRDRATATTRRLLAAAAVLVVLVGIVAIRAAGTRTDPPQLDVGGPSTTTGALAPIVSGGDLPFLVPDGQAGTVTGISVRHDPTPQPDPATFSPSNPVPMPAGIYASPDDAGALVAVETAAEAPTTVGTGLSTGGEPFTAGPWSGTVEVTGSPGSEVRTAVVRDSSNGGTVVVTARQVDDAELVRLIAGLHAVPEPAGGLRLAEDSGLVLVSDGLPGPNGDRWEAEWDVDGDRPTINHYRETGNPRFIDRLAASPTMTRITVGGRPGAVLESGGYTVFSWLPTAYDVVEIRVTGEGAEAVAHAATLAHGSKAATGTEVFQAYPDLVIEPEEAAAVAAPFQQGTPLPAGTTWSSFALPTDITNEGALRTEIASFAACAWFDAWRSADAAGSQADADAARATLNDARNWSVMAGTSGGWAGVVAQFADEPTPPDAGRTARAFDCR